MNHLAQLSVESLVKMQVPLRAARKIEEWLTFIRRIIYDFDKTETRPESF
jgi:hypothetical protein